MLLGRDIYMYICLKDFILLLLFILFQLYDRARIWKQGLSFIFLALVFCNVLAKRLMDNLYLALTFCH